MSDIDIQAIAKQVTDRFIDRMASEEMPDADFDENASILFNFNNIAVNLLKDEPGLEMPGSNQVFPIDDALTDAIISMFAEGICHAMIRCSEMGLIGDPKKSILQDMALEVYNQAKQIVACTYGQENTPGFQFSRDQQVTMINQASEGHLMYFIGEFEKKNGPIAFQNDDDDQDFLSHGQMQVAPEMPAAPVQPQAAIQQEPQAAAYAPQAQPALQAPQLPAISVNEREKFAAISLLLNAVSSAQREKIFRGIPDKGRAWVEYYSQVSRIPQELHMERVQQRLSQLRNQLKSSSKEKGDFKRAPSPVARLADRYDEYRLLSLVQDERPDIIVAVRREFRQEQIPVQYWRQQEVAVSANDSAQPAEQEVRLPPRIEEILARFLARRLDSSMAMSAKEKYPHAH